MNAHDVIRAALATNDMVLKSYVSDLTDAELLERPGPGCNHLAWQLGHLIASECQLLEMVAPGKGAPLPEGFAEQHSKETATCDDPAAFRSKHEYLELLDTVHAATLAALDTFSADDFDQPGPEAFRQVCPTVGSLLLLIANHPLMHAGQFVPVRRRLGKPVVI